LWNEIIQIAKFEEVDGVIGNEVVGATDGSLTRSGAGTAASPYTLAISTGGVETKHLKDGAVTTEKIGNKAVTVEKIGDNVWTEVNNIALSKTTSNAIVNVSAGGGLVRSGNGSVANPYTIGLLPADENEIMRVNANKEWETFKSGKKVFEHTMTKPAGATDLNILSPPQTFSAGLYWCNVQLSFSTVIQTLPIPYDFMWQSSKSHVYGEAPKSENGTSSINFSFPVFLEEKMNTYPTLFIRGLPLGMTSVSLTIFHIL